MTKNLTKTQVEIEELAKRVPKLTGKQIDWAERSYIYLLYILGVRQRECRCPHCRGIVHFDTSRDTQNAVCPHCGAKLRAYRYFDAYGFKWNKDGVAHDYHKEGFFQVMNVVGDWQVTRLIYMERWCYVRKDNTPWQFYEVCQAWNNPKYGKTYFRSLPKKGIGSWRSCNPYSLHTWRYECTNPDNWSYNKYIECDNVLEARTPGGANYFNTDRIAPDAKVSDAFKRMGVSANVIRVIKNFTALGLFESLSKGNYKPCYETLLKGKEYDLFDKITSRDWKADADKYFTAWKICKRHGYDYKKNYTEWMDTLKLIFKRGLDYRNPKFVCPDDLHRLHNQLLDLERRDEERREEQARRERIERLHQQTEKEMKDIEKAEKGFKKRREKYFGINIKSDLFNIVALKSVKEFKYEGTYLAHCVFRCGYYRNEHSLILSARDEHNNPIETIEIDLRSFTILQCYGNKDTYSPLHKEIIKTMEDNMWQVKDIALGRKRKAA